MKKKLSDIFNQKLRKNFLPALRFSTSYCGYPFSFFPSVYSPFFCGRGGLYALRVNDCVAGACVSPCVCPHPFHQRRTDILPKPVPDCGVIKIGHCGVRRKVVGQISPFAAVIHKIPHCVYQFPLFPFAPVSCWREQRPDDGPLAVAQITRILASFIFLYHAYILALFYLLVQLLNSRTIMHESQVVPSLEILGHKTEKRCASTSFRNSSFVVVSQLNRVKMLSCPSSQCFQRLHSFHMEKSEGCEILLSNPNRGDLNSHRATFKRDAKVGPLSSRNYF